MVTVTIVNQDNVPTMRALLSAAGYQSSARGDMLDVEAEDIDQVRAVISAYMLQPTAAQVAQAARKAAAKGEIASIAQLKSVTPAQAVAYIENNVTSLATAKDALKLIVRILIAYRDTLYPELPEE